MKTNRRPSPQGSLLTRVKPVGTRLNMRLKILNTPVRILDSVERVIRPGGIHAEHKSAAKFSRSWIDSVALNDLRLVGSAPCCAIDGGAVSGPRSPDEGTAHGENIRYMVYPNTLFASLDAYVSVHQKDPDNPACGYINYIDVSFGATGHYNSGDIHASSSGGWKASVPHAGGGVHLCGYPDHYAENSGVSAQISIYQNSSGSFVITCTAAGWDYDGYLDTVGEEYDVSAQVTLL